jgi:hypothetical protein
LGFPDHDAGNSSNRKGTAMSPFRLSLVAACAAFCFAGQAQAACQKLTFAVNDYGKDGPTRDALSLLDKHVAEWTVAKGIKKYSVGKKDVSCELFLDVGVFDEHTCTASTTVCWK